MKLSSFSKQIILLVGIFLVPNNSKISCDVHVLRPTPTLARLVKIMGPKIKSATETHTHPRARKSQTPPRMLHCSLRTGTVAKSDGSGKQSRAPQNVTLVRISDRHPLLRGRKGGRGWRPMNPIGPRGNGRLLLVPSTGFVSPCRALLSRFLSEPYQIGHWVCVCVVAASLVGFADQQLGAKSRRVSSVFSVGSVQQLRALWWLISAMPRYDKRSNRRCY